LYQIIRFKFFNFKLVFYVNESEQAGPFYLFL